MLRRSSAVGSHRRPGLCRLLETRGASRRPWSVEADGQDNGGEPVLHYVLEYAPDGCDDCRCVSPARESLRRVRTLRRSFPGAALQHLAGAQGAEKERAGAGPSVCAPSQEDGPYPDNTQRAAHGSSKIAASPGVRGDLTCPTVRFTKTIFNLGQGLVPGARSAAPPSAVGGDAAAQVSVPDPGRDQCRRWQGSAA